MFLLEPVRPYISLIYNILRYTLKGGINGEMKPELENGTHLLHPEMAESIYQVFPVFVTPMGDHPLLVERARNRHDCWPDNPLVRIGLAAGQITHWFGSAWLLAR